MTIRPEEFYPWLGTDAPEASPAAEPVPALSAAPVPRLALTSAELGIALGVSQSTIAGWLRSGDAPPYVRLPGGRLVRFPVALAERWLAERACGAVDDQAIDRRAPAKQF